MEIQASLLIAQLKSQRNAFADEAALAVAQCHHLMEECAKLKELSDKQQGLLAEADKLMSAMAKEKDAQVPTFYIKDLASIGDTGHIMTSGNISPLTALSSEPIKIGDRTPEPYKGKRYVHRSNGTDAAPFCATEDPPTQ